MKHSATLFDLAPQARAARPLPEPALTYFPDVRSVLSDRDLAAGAAPIPHGAAMVDEPHVPVLLDRCVELLAPALTGRAADGAGATLIDATLGAGGHAERFLARYPGLHVIGLDRDPDALRIAGERLAPFGERFAAVRTRYDGFDLTDGTQVDAFLFDLGVSSMQLDRPERGFSYAADAPLDMRMDTDAALTAADILNTYEEKQIARVLREYGEERFAGRIAAPDNYDTPVFRALCAFHADGRAADRRAVASAGRAPPPLCGPPRSPPSSRPPAPRLRALQPLQLPDAALCLRKSPRRASQLPVLKAQHPILALFRHHLKATIKQQLRT